MFLAVVGVMSISAQYQANAQEAQTDPAATEQVAPAADETVAPAEEEVVDPFAAGKSDQPLHQQLTSFAFKSMTRFVHVFVKLPPEIFTPCTLLVPVNT